MVDQNVKLDPLVFKDEGKGPPVVLINGLGRSSRHWLGFDDTLRREHLRVITLDMRGVGTNTRPVGWNLTVNQMAQDVVEVLDILSIEKAHIFGISLGGMVALELALKAPHRAHSLTVVNSSIATWETLFSRISLRALSFLMQIAIDRPKPEVAAKNLVDLVVGIDMPDEDRKSLASELAELESRFPVHVRNVLKQLVAAARFGPVAGLKRLQVPTQVVVGGYDAFVPRMNSLVLTRLIPGSKLLVIPNGGHELMYDKQGALVHAVCDLVNRVEHRWMRLAKSI